jgi:hypothetical protein
MKVERFTFVKHKLTGQKMYVVDTGVIVARVETATQDPNLRTFETIEVNEEEVETIGEGKRESVSV